MVPKSFILLLISSTFTLLSCKPTDYTQCDPLWKDQYLSLNSTWPSICDSGDQLTVLSMLVDGCGVRLPGTKTRVDPGTLNTWLSAQHGFNDDMSVDIPTFAKVGIDFKFAMDDVMQIKKLFKHNTYAVALQNKEGQWYALKSFSSWELSVCDPRGQNQNMNNDDFKHGLVFYSHNCEKGTRSNEFLTE